MEGKMTRTTASPVVQSIRHAAGMLFEPGQVVELRVLNFPRAKATTSGYYDDLDALAQAAARFNGKTNVYVTVNPINPALLARACNRVIEYPKATTSDADVLRRVWFLIDFDPVRPSGVSSTAAEHDAALDRANKCRAYLSSVGWSPPIEADSGNGGHLAYAIDLPNDDGAKKLVEQCLAALDFLFSDAVVHVDRTVFNAARIWKLYGTTAVKGDNTQDRPHRTARILSAPDRRIVVPVDLLQALAALRPPEQPKPAHKVNVNGKGAGRFDVPAFIARHNLEVANEGPWMEGYKWILAVCPWNEEHTNLSAFIIQHQSGALSAKCHHAGCQGKNWFDLRAMLEPGCYDRRDRVQSNGQAAAELLPWPEPQPIPSDLPPVQPFTGDKLLPKSFRDYIADVSDRMQCPPDFPGVALMVVLAGIAGTKVCIRPKRADDWTVVPNLWATVVGRPGVMKTPAIREPLRFLQRLEAAAGEEYKEEQSSYILNIEIFQEQMKLRKEVIKKAIKANNNAIEAAKAFYLGEEPVEPKRGRYLVNDSTVEKLGELLNANPNGLTLFRDELVGLFRSLEREGQEGARAFYLEAWDGGGSYTYDRIGRGTLHILHALLSLLGGMTPGKLLDYLRGAIQQGGDDDGLFQRLQLLVYPDVSPTWVNVDRWPETKARQRVWNVLERLDKLDPASLPGILTDQDTGCRYLRFDGAAQQLFDDWRTNLEQHLRSGEEHPAVESHLAKYRSLIPSLALLLHLADHKGGPVGVAALRKAFAWDTYLRSHMRRVYSLGIDAGGLAAKVLGQHLNKGDLKDEFRPRDVYRKHWTGLADPQAVNEALDVLLDLGWLQGKVVETAGRRATHYLINPKLASAKTGQTPGDRSARRGEGGASGTSGTCPPGLFLHEDDPEEEDDVVGPAESPFDEP
jgi:hypothetical protein